MDKKETHDLMNSVVDTIDTDSLALFEDTDGDVLIIGVVASKDHGQMLIHGPLDTESLIGMMLTVISGGGNSLGIINEADHRYMSDLASNLIKVD